MNPKVRLLLGSAFVLLLSLIGLFFAIQLWMPFMWFILLPAIGCLIAAIYIDRRLIVQFLTMKTTKHGLNFGVLVLIVFCILIAINFLVVKKNKVYDFSLAQQYTLSPLTIAQLNNLKSDIYFRFFYKDGSEGLESSKKAFSIIAKMYQEASPRVKVEFIEMNAHPKLTESFGANKGMGEAFVEYNNQKNKIESQFLGQQGQKFGEQEITNAIIKVSRTNKKTIYFLEGHQERDIENEQNEFGAYAFKQMLEKNSFNVKKLNLALTTDVPQDASVIVVLGPQIQLQKFEIEAIVKYLTRGGSLFLTLDNKISANFQNLLSRFGLKHDQQFIFNILNSPMGQIVNSGQPTVAVDYSKTSEITKMFNTNQTSIFVKPNSLSLLSIPELISTQVLIKTPVASVALLNLDSEKYEGKPQAYNIAAEVSGRLSKDAQEFKAVIVADTDFISNSVIFQNVNRDIALNAVSHLSGDNDLISITPKEVNVTKAKMSPPEFNQFFKFTVMGLFLPIPFLFLAISIGLWVKQRHL